MSLAHAGRAEEDDIFSIFQKTHGGQLLDLSLINGGLETEIKVLQRLFDGEAQHLYLFFIGPFAFAECLPGKDVVEHLHDVKLVLYRSLEIIVQYYLFPVLIGCGINVTSNF